MTNDLSVTSENEFFSKTHDPQHRRAELIRRAGSLTNEEQRELDSLQDRAEKALEAWDNLRLNDVLQLEELAAETIDQNIMGMKDELIEPQPRTFGGFLRSLFNK